MYNYIIHRQKKKQRYNRFHIISNFTMETNIDKNNPQNEFFFNKNGEVRMENRQQYKEFLVDYYDIWVKIESYFGGNDKYTSKLIQSMVGEAFKIRPFPTRRVRGCTRLRWERHSK